MSAVKSTKSLRRMCAGRTSKGVVDLYILYGMFADTFIITFCLSVFESPMDGNIFAFARCLYDLMMTGLATVSVGLYPELWMDEWRPVPSFSVFRLSLKDTLM